MECFERELHEDVVAVEREVLAEPGYREAGYGTLSFYDAEGERLSTVRLARMPEEHQALEDTAQAR